MTIWLFISNYVFHTGWNLRSGPALSTLFSVSVGCLLKVRWAPKCYLLFSLLLFFCAPWHSMSFLWKLMLPFTSVLLVSLSSPSCLFCFSFSFPLLFKLYLCNSLELHTEKTWLDCKLSRVTNEMSLGNLSLDAKCKKLS